MKRVLPGHEHGLSLIELIVFIVVVSVGLAGVLSVLNVGVRASADPLVRKQAMAIAEAMLDEVLSKDYDNVAVDPVGCTALTVPACRPNTLADRPNYNDVADYNGWNQAGAYPIDSPLTQLLPEYTVSVAVSGWTLSGVSGQRITVTVSRGTESIAIESFRAPI